MAGTSTQTDTVEPNGRPDDESRPRGAKQVGVAARQKQETAVCSGHGGTVSPCRVSVSCTRGRRRPGRAARASSCSSSSGPTLDGARGTARAARLAQRPCIFPSLEAKAFTAQSGPLRAGKTWHDLVELFQQTFSLPPAMLLLEDDFSLRHRRVFTRGRRRGSLAPRSRAPRRCCAWAPAECMA